MLIRDDFHRKLIPIRWKSRTQSVMDGIRFDNLALRTLPIDSVEENYVRSVSGACFSRVSSSDESDSRMISFSLCQGKTNSGEKPASCRLFS